MKESKFGLGSDPAYNNPDMDIVELAFVRPGVELWEFIGALERIEDRCLEELETYPNAKLPRIFIGTKERVTIEGTETVLYACVSQRLHSNTGSEETV